MLSWVAQQKMQNRNLMNMMNMMNGNCLAMPNQTRMMPWGNGGRLGGKGNSKGGNIGGGKKEVARGRTPTTCRDRMLPHGTPRAADAVACILAANVQRTSTRPSVRSATYRDT